MKVQIYPNQIQATHWNQDFGSTNTTNQLQAISTSQKISKVWNEDNHSDVYIKLRHCYEMQSQWNIEIIDQKVQVFDSKIELYLHELQ